jgi:hypothetical protein
LREWFDGRHGGERVSRLSGVKAGHAERLTRIETYPRTAATRSQPLLSNDALGHIR